MLDLGFPQICFQRLQDRLHIPASLLGTKLQSPTWWHQSQDRDSLQSAVSGPSHPPVAIISPGISCVPPLPKSMPVKLQDTQNPYLQLCQAQARPTSGSTSALGPQALKSDARTWLCRPMGQHQPQDLAAQTGQQAPAPGSPRPWLPTREPALALRSPREQQTAISRPGLANPRLVSSAQGRAWPPTDHGASSPCQSSQGFPNSSVGKESTCNAGDPGLISGLERSHGEGEGYPFQYSGLENSIDWIVHGVANSWTCKESHPPQLKDPCSPHRGHS